MRCSKRPLPHFRATHRSAPAHQGGPADGCSGIKPFGGAVASDYIWEMAGLNQISGLDRMFGLPRSNERPRNVRLDTLIRLRWLAVLGQFAAVLVVHFGLEFEVPIWPCIAVISLAAILNVALRVSFHQSQ